MVHFDSFSKPLRAAVFGASGGIGQAFVDLLSESGDVATLDSFSRSGRVGQQIDFDDERAIERAFADIGGPLDLVICAIGILHDTDQGLAPEKSYRALNAPAFTANFAANTIIPALIAKHALPRLRTDAKAALALLSARVGSIGDNQIGGWHAYRASKAALNQIVRCLAIEHGRRHKQAVILALQPGTVDTALSAPFQRQAQSLFSPQFAAEKLLNVVDAATPEQSGRLLDWKGCVLPF